MDRPLLTATEAAARLGVKRETLYAYVSRGVLERVRRPGRESGFDPAAIDALARRSRAGRRAAFELTIASAVASVDSDRLRYRGRDAVGLIGDGFEAVASLLWTGELDPVPCRPAAAALAVGRAAVATLPDDARGIDRVRVLAAAAATTDRLRFDLSRPSVVAAARSLLGVMADGLPLLGDEARAGDRLAARLWPRLTGVAATPGAVDALDGALVLLADHELATSTFAARVAASTRANPYAVVGAGLGALDGPLHGTVSELVHRLLADASRIGADNAVAALHRQGGRLPGFGHAVYTGADPRATALMALVDRSGLDAARVGVAHAVLGAVTERTAIAPNSDYALGALAFGADMPADAGEAIFAIARTAGWLAHALEEYGEAPLRFRARAMALSPLDEPETD